MTDTSGLATADTGAYQLDIVTFTDADYAQPFRVQLGTTTPPVYEDFTGCTMALMVRVHPEDVEVMLSLTSAYGLPVQTSGIDIYDPSDPVAGPGMWEFAVVFMLEDLQRIPEGEYVQSLIVTAPDGFRRDIWRGNFTNSIGPTRGPTP
jgi:hypothetical protein